MSQLLIIYYLFFSFASQQSARAHEQRTFLRLCSATRVLASTQLGNVATSHLGVLASC